MYVNELMVNVSRKFSRLFSDVLVEVSLVVVVVNWPPEVWNSKVPPPLKLFLLEY